MHTTLYTAALAVFITFSSAAPTPKNTLRKTLHKPKHDAPDHLSTHHDELVIPHTPLTDPSDIAPVPHIIPRDQAHSHSHAHAKADYRGTNPHARMHDKIRERQEQCHYNQNEDCPQPQYYWDAEDEDDDKKRRWSARDDEDDGDEKTGMTRRDEGDRVNVVVVSQNETETETTVVVEEKRAGKEAAPVKVFRNEVVPIVHVTETEEETDVVYVKDNENTE